MKGLIIMTNTQIITELKYIIKQIDEGNDVTYIKGLINQIIKYIEGK